MTGMTQTVVDCTMQMRTKRVDYLIDNTMHVNAYTLFAALVSLLLWAGLFALGRWVIAALRMQLWVGRY